MRRRPRRRAPRVASRARLAGVLVLGGLLLVATSWAGPGATVAAQEPSTPTTVDGASTSTTTTTTTTPGTGATTTEPLSISAVSPWVASDGEFQVRFAPSTTVPPGAELTYTIHQSLVAGRSGTLRDRVNDAMEGSSTGPILRTPVTQPLAAYGDPASGAVLSIPVRAAGGDRSRELLPNPGMHPVELVLTAEDGPELWRQVVFLNRLPVGWSAESASGTPAVDVSLVAPLETYPTLTADGTPAFSIEQRATLDAAAELLRVAPEAPLRWGVRPNTLDGLARTGERWSEQLIDALATATVPDRAGTGASVAASLLALPYVHVDTGGLVDADAADELAQQIALGATVDTEVIGHRGALDAWTMDDTVTTESLPVLGSLGVDTVVVPAASLRLPSNVSERQAMTGALELEGGNGIRAIAYDMDLSQRLSDRSVDPGLRAHEVVSLMLASWYDTSNAANLGRAPVSVILVPPTIDPAVITALTPSLDGSGPLRADTSRPVLPAAGPAEPTAALARRDVPDERAAVRAATETAHQIAAYRSMVGPESPTAALWDRLNAESLAAEFTGAQRLALHDSVRGQIAAETARIQPPPARSVQVTGRHANIPLRIRNDLTEPVTLLLTARSPRLQIEGGDSRQIVLEPGENLIDLPVEVQAPGQSLLRVELLTPDGGIQLASLDVPVRSTAISGVGAALSIISIAFLLGWWVHTHRRKRREESRAAGAHPCQAATAPDAPTEPSSTDPAPTAPASAAPAATDPPTAGPPVPSEVTDTAGSDRTADAEDHSSSGDPSRSTADGSSTGSVTGGG